MEESTAERVIKDFLIPNFCPKLKNRLRTISAGGISEVEPRFIEFFRLFVFIHTVEPYKDKAWVFVDGDPKGKDAVSKLRNKFSSWNPKQFQIFEEENFEKYYPKIFDSQINAVLMLPNDQAKRDGKKKLINDVMEWATTNQAAATSAFADSAKEIIQKLQEIESQLCG